MHSSESVVYNRFYIVYDYNHYNMVYDNGITNVQYILRLNFLSPILSVLPLNCFTTVGASHYYTYIYASYVMYEYNL